MNVIFLPTYDLSPTKWEALKKTVDESFPKYQVQKTDKPYFEMSRNYHFGVPGERVQMVITNTLQHIED